MNRLRWLLFLCVATPVCAQSLDAYLVPIAPSQLRDGQSVTWSSAISGLNRSSSEVPLQCSAAPCPRAVPGPFYLSGPHADAERPLLLFIPSDRQHDIAAVNVVTAVPPSGVEFHSHQLQIPIVPLAAIRSTTLTFLNIAGDNYHDRVTFRVYGTDASTVTLRIFFRDDRGEFAGFERTYALRTTTANGVTVGYAKVPWPSELTSGGAPAMPVRVELTGDKPLWGFATTTENDVCPTCGGEYVPAVSMTMPVE